MSHESGYETDKGGNVSTGNGKGQSSSFSENGSSSTENSLNLECLICDYFSFCTKREGEFKPPKITCVKCNNVFHDSQDTYYSKIGRIVYPYCSKECYISWFVESKKKKNIFQ